MSLKFLLHVRGQLRFECRYSKTRVNDFACNYIIISDNISIEPEKPDTPEEPEEPNEPDEPLVLPRLLAINRSPSLFSNYNIIFRWISVRRYSLYRVSVMLLV